MTEPEFQFARLRDPRFAAHALNPAPVWLWNASADRILWANPNGAAIFDAASCSGVSALRFNSGDVRAAQIARLAGTLSQGAAPRLERLRGFGANIGSALICLCSRITLADNSGAILVVSTERVGKDLSLRERAARLLEGLQGPAALFTADGELIEAQAAARERVGGNLDFVTLGAERLAREATLNGSAEGEISAGRVCILKLGAGPTFALLVVFNEPEMPSDATQETEASKPPDAGELQTRSHQIPSRFVWQTDADNRFSLASTDFADLLGPHTAAVLNHDWTDIVRALDLDPQGQIAKALTARVTFSNILVFWPIDNSGERLAVEMSGLPIFDRERQFRGFRGFGLCRNADRIENIPQPSATSVSAESESKVVPFPTAPLPLVAEPAPSARDHSAFQELARELNERLKKPADKSSAKAPPEAESISPPAPPPREAQKINRDAQESRPILDRLSVGILVYRLNNLIYANRAFLDWAGHSHLDAFTEAGGIDSLFIKDKDKSKSSRKRHKSGSKSLTITTINNQQKPVEGRLSSVVWNGENALLLVIDTHVTRDDTPAPTDADVRHENNELRAILDTATDGVLVLDPAGHVLSANRSAQALFGYEPAHFVGLSVEDLLVPESQRSVLDHLDRLARGAGTGILDAGYEVIGRVRQGGLVPLHITMGRIESGEKLCAVLRDITAWKRNEGELVNARRAAEQASSAKSEFLAKISHEIRTPLNTIIGFSEVMMDERFGPIGNERYRQYLKDIHSSGGHLVSLLNDLLDLSKIEAGGFELTFVGVNLNDLIQQCVAILQQQANRERVIIRTSLPATLPQIIADARSMRQIVLNLLSNSIKFAGAGGQVIISTALTDDQEVVLRVRDTGCGMSEKELQTALEPFRKVATVTHWGSIGTGLGLPITKALAEANHASFRITSGVDDGTLVELTFPATRVLAQ